LFEKNNRVYRFTKTSSLKDAESEIDVCGAASRAGLFPMKGMPEYFEDTRILKITMENMDGDLAKLKSMSGTDMRELRNAVITLVEQFNNLGFCHGDLDNGNNIMYKDLGDNKYRLYLIDFTRSTKRNNSCRNLDFTKSMSYFKQVTRPNKIINKKFIVGNARRFSPIKNVGTPTSNPGTPRMLMF
tara:strand:+ start:2900 stop:3457 length:558 start_codon:yes stop_codon:yes gene_type:complete